MYGKKKLLPIPSCRPCLPIGPFCEMESALKHRKWMLQYECNFFSSYNIAICNFHSYHFLKYCDFDLFNLASSSSPNCRPSGRGRGRRREGGKVHRLLSNCSELYGNFVLLTYTVSRTEFPALYVLSDCITEGRGGEKRGRANFKTDAHNL